MIGICEQTGSFSDRWIEYCEQHSVDYHRFDLYDTEILPKLRVNEVNVLLAHPSLSNLRFRLGAKSVLQAAEDMGIVVFPNHATYWHHDDKIAQKHCFEALDIPRCPTWVFYDQDSAMEWATQTQFPKVFKLRCGAGSSNVRLIPNRSEATRVIKTMFGRGMTSIPSVFSDARTKMHKHGASRDWGATVKRLPATLARIAEARRDLQRERGYAYFQEFLPGNTFDTRVTVIGNRAFGFRRFVRPNDFRASGSGRIDHNPDAIDIRCVEIAHATAAKLDSQSMAFDFVYDEDRNPVVIEMCCGYMAGIVHACPGYWDREMVFHEGHQWPQDAILEDALAQAASTVSSVIAPTGLQ